MPETESASELEKINKPEKRKHICGAPRASGEEGIAVRDEEGNCKECGVPIDEFGFEAVDPVSDKAVRDILSGEGNIPKSPQELLKRIKDPNLNKIVKEHYEKKGYNL